MTEPIIDPATGKPKENNSPPPDDGKFVQISAEEWGNVKGRLDAFEKIGFQQQPLPAPAAPTGPTFADQVKEIDTGIEALNSQIDDAVKNGHPVSTLLGERDTLSAQRLRLKIKHEDIDPVMSAGIDTIDQLSDTVTRSQMPHIELVRTDFDAALNSLPVEQRMNPKMRQAAYNIAVGQNIDKIMEAKQEADLRAASEPPPPPGESSRSSGNDQDTVPKPQDVLSRETMKALQLKGQTPDAYYKSLGYEGWNDFYTKRGKEYFS